MVYAAATMKRQHHRRCRRHLPREARPAFVPAVAVVVVVVAAAVVVVAVVAVVVAAAETAVVAGAMAQVNPCASQVAASQE